jgi:hypothetical protein
VKTRLLAVATAVVMVIVAVAIRAHLNSGSATSTPSASGPVTIACVTELEAQCKQLRNVTVRVEDASVTAKAIAGGTAGIDGWVTFEPWPEIANQLALRNVTGASARVASSPLLIAMVQERADALARTSDCGGTVTWKCLGDAIGKQWTDVGGKPEWGVVKGGVPATASGLGLLVLGNAASDYFGRTDFATNDFDDSFTVWRSSVTSTPAEFNDFILQFPALYSAVGTTEQIAAGKGTRPVAEITPRVPGSATVVVAAVGNTRAQALSNDLSRLLKATGWRDAAPPSANGLPNAGVLLALSGLK